MSLEIPGYKILRTLGRGGMATVYLAQQDIFEREVALKVMSKALAENDSFGKRFFREAKIVSQLVHPNIVTVYDVGLNDGNYYLSMEYIDGKDLKAVRKDLTLRQKVNAVKDIAKALDYAGSKGYVHRDIKPENILLNSADGRAVLTDFGIARAAETDTAMTQTGIAIGTPHYMSPEQAKGKVVDPRSDIYSLGVVFFLLLTGRVPFDAESAVAIGIKHITEPVPLLPESLGLLQPLIDALLAKNPEERYQRAGEFLQDMERIDIAILEQSVEYSRQLPDTDFVDSESPTLPGLDDLETIESQPVDMSLAYDHKESIINQRSGIGQWLAAFLIVGSLVTWVLYYQRPELVKPIFKEGKSFAEEAYNDARTWLKSLSTTEAKSSRSGSSELNIEPSVEPAKPSLAATPAPPTSAPPTSAPPTPAPSPAPLIGAVPEPARLDPAVSSESASALAKQEASVAPDVSTPEPPTPTPIDEYRERLESLESLYQDDGSYLAQLVELYRQVLHDYPHDIETADGFNRLQANEFGQVDSLLESQKLAAAKRKLEQTVALFSEVSAVTLKDYEDQIQRLEKIATLLAQADKLREQKRWTEPKGRSAYDRYQQVLAIAPDNADAIKGIKTLAGLHTQAASRELTAGNLSMARFNVERALGIDANYSAAKSLSAKIKAQIKYRDDMDGWMRLAEQRAAGKRFFSPARDNAHYYYQQILDREPSNARAITGQKQVVDSFARYIWSLVGDEQFKRARSEMTDALRAQPKNKRLQSLSSAVEEVLVDKL